MTVPRTTQFRSLSTPSGKKAFDAYTATWTNYGKHVAISAPTLEALKEVYKQIVGVELIAEAAQHVWIVKADGVGEAPVSSDPRGAEIPCSVPGCTELTSFIIKRKAYCMEHRGQAK